MSEPVPSPGERHSYLNGCESVLSLKKIISAWLKGTVLSEEDCSSFHCPIPCAQISSCLHYMLCSLYTKDSGNSSSHSAWSPPLNIIPWVTSLPCHTALSPLFTFTHCSCPIKSELPSGLLFWALKSAKPAGTGLNLHLRVSLKFPTFTGDLLLWWLEGSLLEAIWSSLSGCTASSSPSIAQFDSVH